MIKNANRQLYFETQFTLLPKPKTRSYNHHRKSIRKGDIQSSMTGSLYNTLQERARCKLSLPAARAGKIKNDV